MSGLYLQDLSIDIEIIEGNWETRTILENLTLVKEVVISCVCSSCENGSFCNDMRMDFDELFATGVFGLVKGISEYKILGSELPIRQFCLQYITSEISGLITRQTEESKNREEI